MYYNIYVTKTFETLDLSKKPPTLEQFKQGVRSVYDYVSKKVQSLLGRTLIGSTCRGADDYRELLFPEQESVEQVIQILRGKHTVDIGSGMTHRREDSLPTQVMSRYPESTFVCVDPRLGYPVGHPKGLPEDLQVRPEDNLLQVVEHSRAKLVAAMGEHLPFADASMDYYLSCYLMPWHITQPNVLLQFLSEIHRILKTHGEARLGPLSQQHVDLLTKNNKVRQYLHEHFVVQLCPNRYDENDRVQWVGFDFTMRLVRKS